MSSKTVQKSNYAHHLGRCRKKNLKDFKYGSVLKVYIQNVSYQKSKLQKQHTLFITLGDQFQSLTNHTPFL